MIAAMVISMITADEAPIAHLVAGEGVGIHEGRGHLGRPARPAAGQRDDEVVGLDRQVARMTKADRNAGRSSGITIRR